MTVVEAWRETLLDFVRREGPIMTEAVGSRFGWNTREALRRLNALEKQGLVTKDLKAYSSHGRLGGGRRMYSWRVFAPDDLD